MPDRIRVNEKELLDFYKKWDAIDFKYSLNRNENSKEYIEKYANIEKIEDDFRFSELTKVEYGDILSNLDLIYARKEKSEEIVELFDLIRNKIIGRYISIDGLERLFSEKYIDFEWDMHLGIDYKSHKMKFYRDHFVHQIRNAYCLHILLEKLGWKDIVAKVLLNEGNSKISRYVCKYIGQQMAQGYYPGLENYNTVDFYCTNIIYMASYLAALFHDIGYPEATNAANQRRITEYIANLYNAENSGYNYSRLNSLLQNSLLFRVVSAQEIQQRLMSSDHGALSSVIFLLNFYENGAIHGLIPFKRCAVELAALAIYNHTNKYCYEKKLEPGNYVRISFVLNPISYLLRISDDLQEWGRIYFELSDKSNLIVCNNCKTPIIRKERCENGRKRSYYCCNCDCKEIFYPVFDYNTNFPYRRIYNVTVCENLEIREEKGKICFTLEYELDRLLHIAYINPEYAKYRVKELNALKKLLDYQNDLPVMKLNYFMSANPILIKTWIMRQYLKGQEDDELDQLYTMLQNISNLSGSEQEKEKNLWKKKFEEVRDKIKNHFDEVLKIYTDTVPETVTSYMKRAVEFYICILIFMELHMRYNQKQEVPGDYFNEQEKEYLLNDREQDYNEDLRGLVRDCIKQFAALYQDITRLDLNPSSYYKQYVSDSYTYGCIKRFLAPERYMPVTKRDNKTLDGYTDLALFYMLLLIIEEKSKQ